MRYHTGSYADVKGISLLTGFSAGSSGVYTDATLGMFFELGYATLDTFNEFERGNVSGGGRSRYLGGGLLGRLDVSHAPLKGLYAEASVRAGKLETSWNSDDLLDNMDRKADFDSSTPYYGFHAGIGSILHLTDTLRADIHAKYFWTRQEGQTRNILGDVFDFDAVDSQRLRLGARLEYDLAEKLTPYIGAAWEHEFDGTARSSVPYYGLDIASGLHEGRQRHIRGRIEHTACGYSRKSEPGIARKRGRKRRLRRPPECRLQILGHILATAADDRQASSPENCNIPLNKNTDALERAGICPCAENSARRTSSRRFHVRSLPCRLSGIVTKSRAFSPPAFLQYEAALQNSKAYFRQFSPCSFEHAGLKRKLHELTLLIPKRSS